MNPLYRQLALTHDNAAMIVGALRLDGFWAEVTDPGWGTDEHVVTLRLDDRVAEMFGFDLQWLNPTLRGSYE